MHVDPGMTVVRHLHLGAVDSIISPMQFPRKAARWGTPRKYGRGFPSCDFVSFVVDELGIPRLIRGVHSDALFR